MMDPQKNSEVEVSVGDVVRLKSPFESRNGGVYTHGVVAEIIAHMRGPDSPPRNVSLFPFNPKSETVLTYGSRKTARLAFVDSHVDEFIVVQKANESYKNRDGLVTDSWVSEEAFVESLPHDRRMMVDRLIEELEVLEESGGVSSFSVLNRSHAMGAFAQVKGSESAVQIAVSMASKYGWEVKADISELGGEFSVELVPEERYEEELE